MEGKKLNLTHVDGYLSFLDHADRIPGGLVEDATTESTSNYYLDHATKKRCSLVKPMASLSRNPRFCNLEALPRVPMQQCSKLRSQVCPSRHFSPCVLLSYTTCFIATGGALAPRQGSSPTPGQRCDLFKEVPVGRLQPITRLS